MDGTFSPSRWLSCTKKYPACEWRRGGGRRIMRPLPAVSFGSRHSDARAGSSKRGRKVRPTLLVRSDGGRHGTLARHRSASTICRIGQGRSQVHRPCVGPLYGSLRDFISHGARLRRGVEERLATSHGRCQREIKRRALSWFIRRASVGHTPT
jgi:hypothetical protein